MVRTRRELSPDAPTELLTVDVHSHIKVPKAAAEAMTRFSPELDPRTLYSSEETNALNQAYYKSDDNRFTDPATRLRDMDTMGVDVQAIALAPPQQSSTKLVGCLAITFGCCLGVDGQGESWVRVSASTDEFRARTGSLPRNGR